MPDTVVIVGATIRKGKNPCSHRPSVLFDNVENIQDKN